jgi:hypothetical protein
MASYKTYSLAGLKPGPFVPEVVAMSTLDILSRVIQKLILDRVKVVLSSCYI